jgi:ribosomal protein L3 glutamine methyltransferase
MIEQLDELKTLRDWVRWGASRFTAAGLWFGHGTDNALDEALALVLAAVHLDHSIPESFLDSRLTRDERAQVAALLERRIAERIPAAYLTGQSRFAGLDFHVNENVLIPRSPIAELILNGFEPWLQPDDEFRILDLCTGSGCIAVACAHYFPDAVVDATDISVKALEVARSNVARHGLEDRINLIEGDLYQGLDGSEYDLIVSNPPYVGAVEMNTLPEEYRHEPALALVGGEDGLDLVLRILCEGVGRLKPGGIMAVEVANSAPALIRRFPEVQFLWPEIEHGDGGVFLLTADQLAADADIFCRECNR